MTMNLKWNIVFSNGPKKTLISHRLEKKTTAIASPPKFDRCYTIENPLDISTDMNLDIHVDC